MAKNIVHKFENDCRNKKKMLYIQLKWHHWNMYFRKWSDIERNERSGDNKKNKRTETFFLCVVSLGRSELEKKKYKTE